MAARVRRRAAESAVPIASEEKIARLLALLLVKDIKDKTGQVTLLRAAGFEVREISDMLGITPHHVVVASASARKRRKT